MRESGPLASQSKDRTLFHPPFLSWNAVVLKYQILGHYSWNSRKARSHLKSTEARHRWEYAACCSPETRLKCWLQIFSLRLWAFHLLEFEGATRPSNSSPSGVGVGGPSAHPYGPSAHSYGPSAHPYWPSTLPSIFLTFMTVMIYNFLLVCQISAL